VADDELDLERYRKRLLELQATLMAVRETGDDAAATVELDQARQGRLSRMDALQAQAMSVEARRRRELQMQQVRTALVRIEADEYGWCVSCGEAIDPRRLEHDPATPLCIQCAERAEQA